MTAKPDYAFVPKDWEERTVPSRNEVAKLLRKHAMLENCLEPSKATEEQLEKLKLPT